MIEPYASDDQGRVFVTPAYYEITYGRPLRTVRDWQRRGLVRELLRGDMLYVHLGDCRRLDRETPRQQRRSLRKAKV